MVIVWQFGICSHFLVYCAEKNLATLGSANNREQKRMVKLDHSFASNLGCAKKAIAYFSNKGDASKKVEASFAVEMNRTRFAKKKKKMDADLICFLLFSWSTLS
jgi:predicted ATP-grasp superfamily ATP-dependent carboligase